MERRRSLARPSFTDSNLAGVIFQSSLFLSLASLGYKRNPDRKMKVEIIGRSCHSILEIIKATDILVRKMISWISNTKGKKALLSLSFTRLNSMRGKIGQIKFTQSSMSNIISKMLIRSHLLNLFGLKKVRHFLCLQRILTLEEALAKGLMGHNQGNMGIDLGPKEMISEKETISMRIKDISMLAIKVIMERLLL